MVALQVEVIPFSETNYSYLIIDPVSRKCAVVDPGEASVIAYAIARYRCKLTHILNTHHHSDHTGGNLTLKTAYGAHVYASDVNSRVPGVDFPLHQGGHFDLFGHKVRAFETPGHTMDALCFLVDDCLFTGDTLFAMGCGKLFEGSAHTMLTSLKKIAALPDATKIYPGHEYTHADARFALTIEPDNQTIRKRRDSEPQMPFTLGLEKLSNPFLRTDNATLKRNIHMEDAREAEVLADLRRRKDRF